MNKTKIQSPPWWLFAVIALGAFLSSGIFLGIMTIEGVTGVRLTQLIGFFVLGLLMSWGAFAKR